MKFHNLHYINILENISKLIPLLILSIIRAGLSINNFEKWLKGTWFDILIIIMILFLGYIKWRAYTYYISEKGINIKKGVLIRIQKFVNYNDICSVKIEQPFYYRSINAVNIIIEANGGAKNNPTIHLTLDKLNCEKIISKISENLILKKNQKKTYSPQFIYIAVLSILTSSSISGVLFVSTLISSIVKIFGNEAKDKIIGTISHTEKFINLKLHPLLNFITVAIILGWIISFAINILRNKGFIATRFSETLTIKSGFIFKRNYHLSVKKINSVEIRQNVLTKTLRLVSVFINISGYGIKNKRLREFSTLIPASKIGKGINNLQILMPEVKFSEKIITPNNKMLFRFIGLPLSIISIVAFFILVALYFYSDFNKIITFVGIMIEIPIVWWFIVRFISFFHTGIGIDEDESFTLYRTYGYGIYTTLIKKNKITKVILSQNISQKFDKCCTIKFYQYANNKKKISIPNVPFEKAKLIFDNFNNNHV